MWLRGRIQLGSWRFEFKWNLAIILFLNSVIKFRKPTVLRSVCKVKIKALVGYFLKLKMVWVSLPSCFQIQSFYGLTGYKFFPFFIQINERQFSSPFCSEVVFYCQTLATSFVYCIWRIWALEKTWPLHKPRPQPPSASLPPRPSSQPPQSPWSMVSSSAGNKDVMPSLYFLKTQTTPPIKPQKQFISKYS